MDEVKWATHFVNNYKGCIDSGNNNNNKYPEKFNLILRNDYQSRKLQEDFYDESLSDN